MNDETYNLQRDRAGRSHRDVIYVTGSITTSNAGDCCHYIPSSGYRYVQSTPWQPNANPGYDYQPGYPGYNQLLDSYLKKPEVQRKENDMRGLFEVFIVDPKADSIVFSIKLVAKDKASAELKAVAKWTFSGDVDDFDIVTVRLGDIRPKKETQKVQVVKGEVE